MHRTVAGRLVLALVSLSLLVLGLQTSAGAIAPRPRADVVDPPFPARQYPTSSTDPWGNSIRIVLNPGYGSPADGIKCSGSDPIWPGRSIFACNDIYDLWDAGLADNETPDNNSLFTEVFDSCQNRVLTDSKSNLANPSNSYPYRVLVNWAPSRYLTMPTTAVGCYGTWTMRSTLTQTFSDGHTLIVQGLTTFPNVYSSKLAYKIAQLNPQPTPDGGPIGALEQLGGCGAQRSTHASATDYPVDTSSGNFWHTFTDLSYPGRAEPIIVKRSYNSFLAGVDGRFGYGWSDSYAQWLDITDTAVTFHGCSGSQTVFTWNPSQNTWDAPARVAGSLLHLQDGSWRFTQVSGESLSFDAQGRLSELADDSGELPTTVSYPASDRVVIADGDGRTVTYLLSGGRVSEIQDSSDRHVRYYYDTAGNLERAVGPDGGQWTFSYDNSHRLLTMRSPAYQDATQYPDAVVTNSYDAAGRVAWQTDQIGRKTTFDYASVAGGTVVTSPGGTKTLYLYSDGLLVQEVRDYQGAAEATWTYRYDPQSLGRTVVLDPTGAQSEATYTASGDIETTTDAKGRVTLYAYDTKHRIKKVTSARSIGGTQVTTDFDYTAAGKLSAVRTPLLDDSGTVVDTATWAYGYDNPGHPSDRTSVTDPTGRKTLFTFDDFGNIIKIQAPATAAAPDGATTTFTVDGPRGLTTGRTSPRGNLAGADSATYTTQYLFDSLDRLREVRKPGWSSTIPDRDRLQYSYDPDGRLTEAVEGPGLATTFAYDAAGQLKLRNATGGSTQSFTYDAEGHLETRTDGSTNAVTLDYDNLGNLTTVKDALARSASYTHDPVGRVLTAKDAAGRSTTYSYNQAGELTSIAYPGSATPSVTNIVHDADGRVTSFTDGLGAGSMAYDSLGRLVNRTDGRGKTITYTYDLAGREKSLTYPDSLGTVNKTYDPAGNLAAIADFTGQSTTFDYDADSDLVAKNLPNGISTRTSFTPAGLVEQVRHLDTRNQDQLLASFGYQYDGSGRVSSVTTTGGISDSHTYTYDADRRLGTADGTQLNYSSAGSPTTLVDGSTQTFDDARQLKANNPGQGVSFVGSASDSNATGSTLSLTTPVTTQTGDAAVLAVTVPSGKTVDSVPGFTFMGEVASTSTKGAILKIYSSQTVTSAQTVTVNFKGKFDKSAALGVYHGTATVGGVAIGTTAKSTGTTLSIGTGGTTAHGASLLLVGSNGAPGTWTYPTAMIKRADRPGTTTDVAMGDQISSADTSGGTLTASHARAAELLGVMVYLNPAKTDYRFDSAGYRTSQISGGATTTITHDASGALQQFGSTSYTYDLNGLRASAQGPWGNRTYSWDTSAAVPKMLSDTQAAYIYGPDGTPVERVTLSGSKRFLLQDATDSTRMLVGSDGAVTGTYKYDPYGSPIAMTGDAAENPLRFDGQYQDPGTNLIYLRARNYDPATNQFLSVDPLEVTTGAGYSYANNDPINLSDPTGKCPLCVLAIAALIGGGTDLGIQALTNVAMGCDPFHDINWGQVALSSALAITPIRMPIAAETAPELTSALERTGTALSKSDAFHRSVSWVVDNPAAQRFAIKSGDGVSRELYQLPGEVNGKSGVFEWIIDRSGTNPVINHQRFIPGGSVTGYPNQVVP